MIDSKEACPIEEKIAVIDEWFSYFDTVGRGEENIQEIDQQLLRDVLTHFGAEFNLSPDGLKSLGDVRNLQRREGMDEVWGHEYMSNFNKWTTAWAAEYEEVNQVKLPVLKKSKKPDESSNSKTGGMRHWFGELTSFAAGAITFDQYKEREESRLRNGYARSANLPVEEVNFLPQGKKFPGSIPPTYVEDAWEAVKSRRFETEG